jgi:hypothetical protein
MSDTNYATPAPATGAAPAMSTPATLTNIFFEPTATFDALRQRPRFLIAALLILALFIGFYFLFTQKLGLETVARAQMEAQSPDMDPAQREQQLQMVLNPAVRAITVASFFLIFAVLFSAGAGLYLLGVTLMGKTISYKQALSVWVYSTFPPFLLAMVGSVIILFLSPPDDPTSIAQAANRMNLVHANPSVLVDSTAQPILATLLGAFDLLAFFGLFLAALGLRRMTRMSSGSAWGVVLAIYIVGILLRVGMAAIFGRAS